MSVAKREKKDPPPRPKPPRRFKRMAFGNLETGVALDEWELGSVVVGAMCAENTPPITYPVLKTRMAKAFGKGSIKKGDDPDLLKPFENCWVQLQADPDQTYFADGISEYFGELRCYKIEELGDKKVKAIKWVRISQIKRAWSWQQEREYTPKDGWVENFELNGMGWF